MKGTRALVISWKEPAMNETSNSANKTEWIFCALTGCLFVWMLAGCAHHRDHARYGGSLYESSPQVENSYVGIRAESDFYEPLSPYGRWEVVGSYGRCWIPGRVDRDWRPYSNGYWQRSEEHTSELQSRFGISYAVF